LWNPQKLAMDMYIILQTLLNKWEERFRKNFPESFFDSKWN
jgi:hypothetical protein